MVGLTTRKHAAGGRLFISVTLVLGIALIAIAPLAAGEEVAIRNPVELQPLQQLTATHQRPLFSPSRRPPPKVATPVVVRQEAAPPAPPPSLVVLGIVSENGEGRAMIRAADRRPADKVVRVRTGDDIGGWKVDKVEPRRIVLTRGERSVDFVLFGAAEKGIKSADATARARRDR
ncbi:hypothetical protein [Bradyrhizobium sp. SZCCHNPS2010]|uniref:hypothetical protein n=1 Tax=Bradyrhizobium sp. SZCCHNPS2010 TaxID=3057333 RepID=UPI002916D59E|nr:hypothetical protein [Bradyrhizobium sp. SZCCHNPS2010]